MAVTKDNPEWEPLYKTWLEEKKPGYVVMGSKTFRVLHPSDDDVQFEPQDGGIDAGYSSLSTKGIAQ